MEAGGAPELTIDDMEDAIARVHAVIDEHQGAAWQAVLGHIVTQLFRNGVVAAELWIRSHPNQQGDVELRRAAGGLRLRIHELVFQKLQLRHRDASPRAGRL